MGNQYCEGKIQIFFNMLEKQKQNFHIGLIYRAFSSFKNFFISSFIFSRKWCLSCTHFIRMNEPTVLCALGDKNYIVSNKVREIFMRSKFISTARTAIMSKNQDFNGHINVRNGGCIYFFMFIILLSTSLLPTVNTETSAF